MTMCIRVTETFPGNPLNPDSNCEPYESDLDTNQVFAPCGLIANSMFNGTFKGFKIFLNQALIKLFLSNLLQSLTDLHGKSEIFTTV